ncbi:efflux RND transporter permease subunit [Acidisarcina polymorpha]|nr:MMPL family transporter [Acidisarcina polymorpha]
MITFKDKLPGRHWLMLALAVLLFGLVAIFVDLKPQVTENFFFSPRDSQYKESARIDKIFPSGSQLIVSVAASSISSQHYLERLAQLTRQLRAVEMVNGAESLSDGPKDFADAEKSPFWKRLLIAENGRSSNVVLFASNRDGEELIRRVEAIVDKFSAKDFSINIAGAQYVAEMIRRSLKHDFRVFSLTSILLFGAAAWLLFRSLKLTLGILVTCTSAVLATLLVQSALGEKIGILTANLGTIVFVVTLSHLVYMTFNWQTLARQGDEEEVDSRSLSAKAWRMTLPASFWSMVCASLGFGSLLLVPAKPLRELGYGGVEGTVIALCCAYLMYPSFLEWEGPKETQTLPDERWSKFWTSKFAWPSVAILLVSVGLSFGISRLNTDPSLLDYFKKGTEPRDGLLYVDRNGGSNPLTLVIAAANGDKLDTKEEYDKMWNLQEALEEHKGVGTVLSLPVLMDEGHRQPFAFLFSWDRLLKIMSEAKHDRIASTFVSNDRKLAAFYLRMEEQRRDKPRVEVVNDLKSIVRKQGFTPYLVGGVYQLQGALAKLVASSLRTGLIWLLVFFTGVALIVGRNIRVAIAMIFSLSLVPIWMLGGIGLLHIPVDIISAPATNVCIGMAIDSMVHLVFGVKRAQRDGKEGWSAWAAGRREQWRGIVYSDVIIAAGFAIFALSNFPPTQRFGLVVVAGTVIDILANLFLLPLLGGADLKTRHSVAK